MAQMLLIPPQDHDRISVAVAAGEAASDGEISTMVARRSDDYTDWAVLIAALAGVIPTALVASDAAGFDALLVAVSGGWHSGYSTGQIIAATLIIQLIISAVAWCALLWIPLRLFLTPPGLKRARVRTTAIKAFRLGIEARTRAATGVLIYLSLAEHRAEILGDAAITAKVGPEEWVDAMAALLSRVKAGQPGDGIVAAVTLTGALLATHFPRSHDDVNEMPDRLIEL